MNTASKAVLASLAFSLGGCQSLSEASSLASAEASTVDMADYFALRLAAGEEHLRLNRPTQAIVAFRQASYDQTTAGRAYNGMGVAYARIGRPDLAARYFEMAIAAAPDDERFARNLARLGPRPEARQVELASNSGKVEPSAVDGHGALVQPDDAGPSPLMRVSDREVLIRAGRTPAGMAVGNGTEKRAVDLRVRSTRAGIADVAPESVGSGRPRYPVRIALAAARDDRAGYPVRITLPEAR